MSTVKDLLETKDKRILCIEAHLTAYEALQKMADNNVGSLVVIRDGKFFGLFTERDYARKVILEGKSSKSTSVKDLIDRDLLHVSPVDSIETCMALMTNHRTRHLPVLENGNLIGILSIGDIVKRLIEDKNFVIEQLERYVFSNYGA